MGFVSINCFFERRKSYNHVLSLGIKSNRHFGLIKNSRMTGASHLVLFISPKASGKQIVFYHSELNILRFANHTFAI